MVVGSVASSEHGTPRSTQDIDLVIDPTTAARRPLIETLVKEAFYVSREAVEEAFRYRSQFNVIDSTGRWKADLILRKDGPFDRAEFQRRAAVTIWGIEVFIATAEDTILAKLAWAKHGSSERQLTDVRHIVDVQADSLDRDYIEGWLDNLGVRNLWESLAAP